MSSERDTLSDTSHPVELLPSLSSLFAHLQAEAVEQFYHGYQRWLLQQQRELVSVQLTLLRQQISENEELMRQQQPSAIALAVLARLQSNDVNDVDLLDRMLERGEEWLDTTLQLLIHCEQLGMIPGDYTQWCEHALEGAYNWLASMQADDFAGTTHTPETSLPMDTQDEDTCHREAVTEEMILQKLMSEANEETVELAVIRAQPSPTNQAAALLSQPAEEASSAPDTIEATPAITAVTQTEAQSEHSSSSEPAIHAPGSHTPLREQPPGEAESTPVAEAALTSAEHEHTAEMAPAPTEHSPVEDVHSAPENDASVTVEDAEEYIEVEIRPEELELPPLVPQEEEMKEAIGAVSQQPGMTSPYPSAMPTVPATSSHNNLPPRPSRAKKRGFFSQLFSIIFS